MTTGAVSFDGFALQKVPKARLKRMAEAGEDVLTCHRVLSKTSDNVVGELLRDQGTFIEWNHYPPGDVYDRETHAQYYYHAHPQEARPLKEHGHFHTFLRPKGMPTNISPAPVPDFKLPEGDNDALSHLIAISMDPLGFPLRLFTTNRWVTGEIWYSAGDVIAMLDYFVIDQARPSWPTNRWVTAMLRFFRPQIEQLIQERDVAVADWQASHPGVDVYEDRKLEITSILDISVDDQIKAVNKRLAAKR